MMKEKLIHITGYVCKWEIRVRAVQKPRGQVPCEQCLPVQCSPEVTYQGVLAGGYPGASTISSSTFANTYGIVKAAKQASSDNWGHCWPGSAPELSTCTGTLHLHSSCENLSSHPWSRRKEGASPSPVPFCLCVDQHSQQSQEVLEWDCSLWAWCCASTLSFVVPACAGLYQLQKQLLNAQQFWDLFNKQLSCLPRGARNAGGRTGTAMTLFFSASVSPRVLVLT